MIFGINTARGISKLSQIYVQQFENITSDIYAKYHYKSCYYLYKSEKGISEGITPDIYTLKIKV